MKKKKKNKIKWSTCKPIKRYAQKLRIWTDVIHHNKNKRIQFTIYVKQINSMHTNSEYETVLLFHGIEQQRNNYFEFLFNHKISVIINHWSLLDNNIIYQYEFINRVE